MAKKKPQKKSVVQHVNEPTNIYDRIEPVLRVWAWIAITWMIYRYFFRFSEWTDEFVFKPLVFVAPVLWYVVKKEKRRLESIGLTLANFYTSLYIGEKTSSRDFVYCSRECFENDPQVTIL